MRSTLLTTLATLAKEWRVTLQFRPTKYIIGSGGWTSVLHLTIGGDNVEHGDMTPGIFLEKGEALSIWSSVNENHRYSSQGLELPPIGNWTKIEVGQREEDGEFTFYISIDAKEVLSAKNNKPREFHDVKVYASDPWYTAQPGSIRNLTVESKLEGETLLSPSSFPGCGVKMRWEDGTCITSCKYEQKCETKYEQKCETKYEQQCQTAYEEQCAPKCIKVSDWFGENKWLILFP